MSVTKQTFNFENTPMIAVEEVLMSIDFWARSTLSTEELNEYSAAIYLRFASAKNQIALGNLTVTTTDDGTGSYSYTWIDGADRSSVDDTGYNIFRDRYVTENGITLSITEEVIADEEV
tara:strand:+ start:162 stop:518 length:357 start_codon:yes stop_codon:yes gene_type:complete